MRRLAMLLSLFLATLLAGRLAGQEPGESSLRVLPPADGPVRFLQDALRVEVAEALARREKRFEQLQDAAAITAYQQRLREAFWNSLGGPPEQSPLNARIVGTLKGDGYRIEKLIYESRPGFFVTALLYLPQSAPPYPAVLQPCGHTETGKAAATYQRVPILLAQQGIATLCYDPVGQGERKQILALDADGQPLPKGRLRSTDEHNTTGVAPILLGQCLASYRIWDGIRSLDYLAGREDIDASKLGCTGNSGGGLMTSYLMALDERIVAAAPSCFITTTRRKNERPGPGDAEQNIFAQTGYGMDHADYLLMRAPRPTLICAATQDFVPIEGAWESFREAKRIYTRLGFPERVGLAEADEKHGFSKHLRTAAARWMCRWLLDKDLAIEEPEDVQLHSVADLQCTESGQVLLLPGCRSLFELYRAEAQRLAEQRDRRKEKLDAEAVRRRAGIRPLKQIRVLSVKNAGLITRREYRIEKLVLRVSPRIVLPALYYVPREPNGEPVLYLDGTGKAAAAGTNGPIETLVKSGRPVLAVDLRGIGETETTPWRFGRNMGSNAAEFYIAYMLGKSLAGQRAEDALAATRWLQRTTEAEQIEMIATGKAAIPALHAAACEPQLFSRVQLEKCIPAWQQVLETDTTVDQLENTIHGALQDYELRDLISLYGERKLTLKDPRSGDGKPLR